MEIKAPKVLSIGDFDRFSTLVCAIILEAPPTAKQQTEMRRVTEQFCTEHSGSNICIYLAFEGCVVKIHQTIACNAPTRDQVTNLLRRLNLDEPTEGVAPQGRSPMAEHQQPASQMAT